MDDAGDFVVHAGGVKARRVKNIEYVDVNANKVGGYRRYTAILTNSKWNKNCL